MIQALIILFVGAELLIVYIWGCARRVGFAGPARVQAERKYEHDRPRPRPPRRLGDAALGRRSRGIVLGILAFWLAIPPWTLRTPVVPLAIALLGAGAGAYALISDERRLGGGRSGSRSPRWPSRALAPGLATQPRLDAVFTAGLIAATLRFATPLAFAAIGGIFNERSGVVNIGLEGMMLAGAFFGIWASGWSGSLGRRAADGDGLRRPLALIHAFFSIHLRADQIVSGFAINFLALGLTGYLFRSIYGTQGTPSDISRIPDVTLRSSSRTSRTSGRSSAS